MIKKFHGTLICLGLLTASSYLLANPKEKRAYQTSCERLVVEANQYFESSERDSPYAFSSIQSLLHSRPETPGPFQIVKQSRGQKRCEMAHVFSIESGRVLEIFEWKDKRWLLEGSGTVSQVPVGTYFLKSIQRHAFVNGAPVLMIKSEEGQAGAGFGRLHRYTEYYVHHAKRIVLLITGNGVSESHQPAGEGCFELNKSSRTLRVMGQGQWPDIQAIVRESTVLECAKQKTPRKEETTIYQTWSFDSRQYQLKQ
jgi:hypothetical protein